MVEKEGDYKEIQLIQFSSLYENKHKQTAYNYKIKDKSQDKCGFLNIMPNDM